MNWRERAKEPHAQAASKVIALSAVLIAALVAWILGSQSWARFFAGAVVVGLLIVARLYVRSRRQHRSAN